MAPKRQVGGITRKKDAADREYFEAFIAVPSLADQGMEGIDFLRPWFGYKLTTNVGNLELIVPR